MEDDVLFSSKINTIIKLIFELRTNYPNKKIIVFSRFLKLLDLLGVAIHCKSLFPHGEMSLLQFNGTLTSEQRSYSQRVFNSPDNKRPLFVTAGSGGAGLDLTAGSQIIQSELW